MSLVQHVVDKPLCPRSFGPGSVATEHEVHVRMANAFYNAAPKNEDDGEFVSPDVDKAYSAAVYGPTTGTDMDLYVESSGGRYGGEHVVVEAFYFKCHVCGFILPANRREVRHA